MGRALTPAAGARSLWQDTADDGAAERPSLPDDVDADVAVVGAGFTGLWTAYYLTLADPTLRVVVLEAETAGFGASGRNGGWCSALFPASTARLAALAGRDRALRMQDTMREAVDEVGEVARREGIDCQFSKGGTISLARSRAQLSTAERAVAEAGHWGSGPADLELLDARAARDHLRARRVLGGTYTPHCAALHPLRLVRGLARAAERRGVVIHERTPVTAVGAGRAKTPHGVVRAEVVVRATEGFTPRLARHRRTLVPLYSLMVATAPLPAEIWEEIGLARRQTFADFRHLLIYGQRTADDRIALGGRGAPYHLGSRIRPDFDQDARVFERLRRTLTELFPVLAGEPVTHAWGGPLGVARDWCASVGLDRERGLGWAGGYVGDGVATTNLAGRTLADLILRRDSDLVTLPWVGHRSRRWEPEPLRWLGINIGLRLMAAADTEESLTGRPSRVAAAIGPFTGSI
ncbi:MAG: NAD(P)/FAD-dependent oxidoreductase [Nocardioidaceae bacterium]